MVLLDGFHLPVTSPQTTSPIKGILSRTSSSTSLHTTIRFIARDLLSRPFLELIHHYAGIKSRFMLYKFSVERITAIKVFDYVRPHCVAISGLAALLVTGS